jgi:integrase
MRGSIRKRGATWTAYWFVQSPDGERVQKSKGGFRLKNGRDSEHGYEDGAQDYLTQVLGELGAGTYTEPADKRITLKSYLTTVWLPAVRTGSTRSGAPRRASTIASYEIAVDKWIVPHIGGERLLSLTPGHVERMIRELAAHGGKGGKALGARSTQYAYTVLRMALDMAVRRGYVSRNPAALVERPGAEHREMTSWTAAEAQAFLAGAAKDRLYAAWCLFLARGPRRGELAGLRWSDVDLDAGRVTLGMHTRISVGGKVTESEAKTRAGRRTIPLDPGLVAVLRAHRVRQLEDRMAWAEVWKASDYVFTREDGQPYHPEHFSDRFDRLCGTAKVRRIRLHDARHTAISLMLADGVSVKVAQEMVGHSSPAITQEMYAHVLPGMAEEAGERLSDRLLGPQ